MKNGYTLVGVMVGIALVAAAALVLFGALGNFSILEFRGDRKVHVQQVLFFTANEIQKLEFDLVWSRCNNTCGGGSDCAQSSANPGPSNGPCEVAGQFNEGVSTSNATPDFINRRINWKSEFDDAGKVCVELTKCKIRGGGRLLEFEITAYWKDPDSKVPFQTRTLVARSSRK